MLYDIFSKYRQPLAKVPQTFSLLITFVYHTVHKIFCHYIDKTLFRAFAIILKNGRIMALVSFKYYKYLYIKFECKHSTLQKSSNKR